MRKRTRTLDYNEPLVMAMQLLKVTVTDKHGTTHTNPRDVAQILYNAGVRLSKPNWEEHKSYIQPEHMVPK